MVAPSLPPPADAKQPKAERRGSRGPAKRGAGLARAFSWELDAMNTHRGWTRATAVALALVVGLGSTSLAAPRGGFRRGAFRGGAFRGGGYRAHRPAYVGGYRHWGSYRPAYAGYRNRGYRPYYGGYRRGGYGNGFWPGLVTGALLSYGLGGYGYGGYGYGGYGYGGYGYAPPYAGNPYPAYGYPAYPAYTSTTYGYTYPTYGYSSAYSGYYVYP